MLRDLFSKLDRPSDKLDHYFEIYEQWFNRFVGKSPKILEIGIQHGGSAELWRRYFGEGTIVHGVDINPLCEETSYLKIYKGDQGADSFWDTFPFNDEGFDIIIDDGSHENKHQIKTLSRTYPHLKDGGIFWCEDVHTSYYNNVRVEDGGYLNPNSFMEFSKRVADVVNAHHTHYAIGIGKTPDGPHVDDELVKLFHDIRGIHFYDSIVVIEKGPRMPFLRVMKYQFQI